MKPLRSKYLPSKRGARPQPKSAGPKKGAASPSEDTDNSPAPPADAAPRMKLPEVLAALEDTAKKLSVRVTYEAIGGELGAGGLCKVKGNWRVIIDKRATPSERVSVLATSLARFAWSDLELAPPVRELLAQVAEKLAPAQAAPPPGETGAASEPVSHDANDANDASDTEAGRGAAR